MAAVPVVSMTNSCSSHCYVVEAGTGAANAITHRHNGPRAYKLSKSQTLIWWFSEEMQ